MSLSVLDIFTIGIGPSSSHTVGPMRAAARFVRKLARDDLLQATAGVRIELYGSLGATGKGHNSGKAVILGLLGEEPDLMSTSSPEWCRGRRALSVHYRRSVALCREHGLSISDLMRANEGAPRPDAETRTGIARIWEVMQQCVRNGCAHDGVLPGPMRVKRRAPELRRQLSGSPQAGLTDPLVLLDWVSLYALAVNEENASGGRVVTAPTNGAAGIIPAVLHYYTHFVHGANVDGVECFLLTAAAIAPSSTRRTPRCQVPRSAVSARSVWPTQWPLARWLKCSAERQRS